MSFDKYSDKAAEAIALIREFAKVEYWDYFKGDPEQALEAFCAMQDAAEEMGRVKAGEIAQSQQAAGELPVVKTWQERLPLCPSKDEMVACVLAEVVDLRAALRAYGQRAAVPIMDGKHKQFEAWAKSNGYCVDMKGNQKAYPSANTQSAWEIWQAAIDTQYSVPGISKNIAEGGKDA